MAHADPRIADSMREGTVIAGKYLVESILGIGGMGVVVAARHLMLDTRVAIKFLLPSVLESPEMVARFAREARAAAKVNCEHVVRVLDVGALDTGLPYMVMELLEGSDLSTWLKERGRLPIVQAVDFMLQVCLALAEAHRLGIVHRDLKPANLFCVQRADGQAIIKVLDFGISKVTGAAWMGFEAGMARTSALMGSPLYMSPEQMQGAADVDALTDVWAVGIILFELLAGRPPFVGVTVPDLCVKIAHDTAPTLRSLRPDAPAGLEDVIRKCLEKDRRRRHRSAADLAVALAEFAPLVANARVEGILAIARTTGTGVGPAPGETAAALSPDRLPVRTIAPLGRTTGKLYGGRKSKMWAIGLIGALAGLILLGGIALVVAIRGAIPTTKLDGAVPAAVVRTRANVAPGISAASVTAFDGVAPATTMPPPDVRVPADANATLSAPTNSTSLTIPSTSPDSSSRTPRSGEAAARVSMATTAQSGIQAVSAPPPGSRASVSCNPPFYFDPDGNRVFKKECVR